MLPTGGIYAVKKRKKPVQKSPKVPPPEGAKSNPSKRHRDRLNQELNKLTNLLPFPDDVRARLDKLSILRLIVGYLKVKGFFTATMKKKNVGWLGDLSGTFGASGLKSLQINGQNITEAELLLQALDGFIIAVTADGYVFYVSPTIQDYLGFHQSDVIYQSVFELIHTDDRAMFRCQLHWALNPPARSHHENEQGDEVELANQDLQNKTTTYTPEHLPPENSSFLERNFVCRFRCLLDNSSGFLALTFQGRLKFLHGQNKRAEDGSLEPPQLAFFAVASPLQPPSILELRTKTFIFQTKHKLDFTPMACDSRGKVVLGYSEMELCMRGTGYQFIHAADMMYCADNHVRMIKTGESGMTVFRLLTKQAGWIWVQANARLVYKGGRPDCIIARQRALSNEEGEEHLRKRTLQLPFTFATGEAVLYQNNLPQFSDPVQPKAKPSKGRKITEAEQKPVDPSSILGAMMKQDEAVYVLHPGTESRFALPSTVDEGWQIDQNRASVKQEGDPLLAILETLLEKGEASDGTLAGLDIDDLDLEGWEESLLQMERDMDGLVGHVSHLSSEVSSFLEDVLFKQENAKDNTFLDGMSLAPVCLQSSTPRHTNTNSSVSAESSSGLGSQDEPPGSKSLHPPLMHFPQNSHVGLDRDARGHSNKQSISDQRSIRFTPAGCSRQRPVAGDFSDLGQVFQRTEDTYVTDFTGQSVGLSCRNPTEKNDTREAPQHQRTPSTSSQMCMWPAAVNTVPQDSTFQSPQNLMGGVQNHMGGDAGNIWQPLASEEPGFDPARTVHCAPGVLTASGQWRAPAQCDSYREQGLPRGSRTGHPQETDLQALLGGSVQYSRGRVQSAFAGASVDFSRGRGVPCQGIGAMEYLQDSVNAVNGLQGQAFHTQTSLAVGHAYQQQQMLSQNQPFSSSLSRTSFQTSTSCRPTPSEQNRLLVLCSQDADARYHSASGVEDPALDSNPHAPIELQGPADYMYPPCGYNKVVLPPHRGSLPQHQTVEACCAVTTPDEAYCFQNIAEEPQLGLSAPSQMDPGFSKSFCQFEPSCPPVSLTGGQQLFSYNIQLEQCHQPDDNATLGFTPSGPTQSHIFS